MSHVVLAYEAPIGDQPRVDKKLIGRALSYLMHTTESSAWRDRRVGTPSILPSTRVIESELYERRVVLMVNR